MKELISIYSLKGPEKLDIIIVVDSVDFEKSISSIYEKMIG